jgi:hypothetical protein
MSVSDYDRPNYPDKRTAIKSIRLFCLDCTCGQPSLVKECPDGGCALHPFRMGHNPNYKSRKPPERHGFCQPESTRTERCRVV